MKKTIYLLFICFFMVFLESTPIAFAVQGNNASASNDGNDADDGSDDSGNGTDDGSGDDSGDASGDGSDDGSDSDGTDDDSSAPSSGPAPASGAPPGAPKWNDSAMSSGPLPPPPPQKAVECFGIMGAGQNDNVFVDTDGRQYGYGEAPACHPLGSIRLPKDSYYACENITVGRTAKGELIRGSLTPNSERRSPEVCYPYDFIKQKITYMNPDYAVPLRGSN